MTATVLITRPLAQARVFAQALEAAHGGSVDMVISPLIETAPVAVTQDLTDVNHVIFTSVNGVQQAARVGVPQTAVAWCVGEKTAAAAKALGFTARAAGGNSESLVALIAQDQPQGRIVHLRGKHAAGDVIGGLAAVGLNCEPVIAYDQIAIAPTQAALDLLADENPVIVPLFSPRTAKLFAQIGAFRAPLHLITMSKAITVPEDIVPISSLAIMESDTMVNGTMALYRSFSPPR